MQKLKVGDRVTTILRVSFNPGRNLTEVSVAGIITEFFEPSPGNSTRQCHVALDDESKRRFGGPGPVLVSPSTLRVTR